jgi:hypothetical protein
MEYINSRGWRYRVMRGIPSLPRFDNWYDTSARGTAYKAYRKTSGGRWKCVRTLPWRDTREAAEKDLAAYAARHGMKEE